MPKNFDFDAQNEIFLKLGTAAESARNHTLALFIFRERGLNAMGYKGAKKVVKPFFFLLQCLGEFLKFCRKDLEKKIYFHRKKATF